MAQQSDAEGDFSKWWLRNYDQEGNNDEFFRGARIGWIAAFEFLSKKDQLLIEQGVGACQNQTPAI